MATNPNGQDPPLVKLYKATLAATQGQGDTDPNATPWSESGGNNDWTGSSGQVPRAIDQASPSGQTTVGPDPAATEPAGPPSSSISQTPAKPQRPYDDFAAHQQLRAGSYAHTPRSTHDILEDTTQRGQEMRMRNLTQSNQLDDATLQHLAFGEAFRPHPVQAELGARESNEALEQASPSGDIPRVQISGQNGTRDYAPPLDPHSAVPGLTFSKGEAYQAAMRPQRIDFNVYQGLLQEHEANVQHINDLIKTGHIKPAQAQQFFQQALQDFALKTSAYGGVKGGKPLPGGTFSPFNKQGLPGTGTAVPEIEQP